MEEKKRSPEQQFTAETAEDSSSTQEKIETGASVRPKIFRINIHIVVVVVVLLVILITIFQLKNWGEFIGQDEIFQDGLGEYDDTLDLMLPLLDEEGRPIQTASDRPLNILLLGNAPFADDRDSEDGLANIIGQMTGANIYNCSITGSYMAAVNAQYNMYDAPMDAYTPYWLAIWGSTGVNGITFERAEEILKDQVPADAKEALDTLEKLDFNDLDVMVILYDASDYLMGHRMYSDDNSTDISQFTGNLEATIEFVQQNHPRIRIIVLSPPYAYSDVIDENGEYVSSDVTRYGQDVLSTYVIKEYTSCANRQVTFVDNLYGTITEDNAKDYLTDNLHLNVEGRRLIAQRFVKALNYYKDRQ